MRQSPGDGEQRPRPTPGCPQAQLAGSGRRCGLLLRSGAGRAGRGSSVLVRVLCSDFLRFLGRSPCEEMPAVGSGRAASVSLCASSVFRDRRDGVRCWGPGGAPASCGCGACAAAGRISLGAGARAATVACSTAVGGSGKRPIAIQMPRSRAGVAAAVAGQAGEAAGVLLR